MKAWLRVFALLLLGLILLTEQGKYFSAESYTLLPTPTVFATANSNRTSFAPITPTNAQQIKTIKRLGLGSVKQVMWSPDGKLLAICSTAGIWLYRSDLLNNEPRLLQDNADCEKLVFSPNDLFIASFGNIDDPTVRVWDMETGKIKVELRWKGDTPHWIYSIVFSPNNSLLAFGGVSGVQVWNFATQTQQSFSTLPYGATTTGLAFNPEGTLLAAAEPYGIDVWDVQTGKKRAELYGAVAEDVRFSPDGKLLAAISGDSVRLWNVTGGERAVLFNHDRVYSTQFSSDATKVITGNANSVIEWDLKRYSRRSTIKNPFAPVQKVALNPNNTLAAGIDDRQVQVFIWETDTGKLRATLQEFTREMRFVRFSPISLKLAYGGNNGVWLWDSQSNTQKTLKWDPRHSYSVAGFFNDGKTVYVGDSTAYYEIWDTESGKEISNGKDAPYGDRKTISPNGKTLAVGRPDHSILLVDIETGKVQQTLKGHTDMIRYLVFSTDGKLLASAANDSTLRIWNTTTGSQELKIAGAPHSWVADVIAFSSDATQVVTSVGNLGTITFWDIKTGKSIRTLQQPSANFLRIGVGNLVFSPDNAILASSGFDGNIYLWEVQSGILVDVLVGHLNAILSMNFTADGKLLASASEDGTVRVWGVLQ